MMRRIALCTAVCLLLCATLAQAQNTDALKSAIRARYGAAMKYYTVVPYKTKYFAACYNVDSATRNSTGKKTRWGIWENLGGKWKLVFEFTSTVDADEESERLDKLFAKYQFSPDTRHKLMDGTEKKL